MSGASSTLLQSAAAPLEESRRQERGPAVGLHDLLDGLAAWRLWTMLSWNDIRQRYRRSALGPFWITISMAIFISLLGVIYARIFHMELAAFLPYIAVGLITWAFIAGTTSEACGSFIESANIIKQRQLPFTIYVMRTVWRAFIVFLHTIVLIVPIALVFGLNLTGATALVVPGLLLVFANQIWVAIVIAVLSTRYRDITQLVGTTLQIAMFATPIMWPVSALQNGRIIADVNPLYHLIELVRTPLLGGEPAPLSWAVVGGSCVIGYAAAVLLLWRAKARLVYWL